MTLTRWKMLAGIFGLGVCGIAALAEPACRSVGQPAARTEPAIPATPESKSKGGSEAKPVAQMIPVIDVTPAALPVPVPAQAPVEKPPSPQPVVPEVGVTTPAEIKPTPTPLPLPEVALPPTKPVPESPAPAPIPQTILVTPTLPAPTNATPIMTFDQFQEVVKPSLPQPVPLIPVTEIRPVSAPATPITPTPTPTPASFEKKLKVTLTMDETNPKFEVRDGDEVVLKVISEKVDVTSPKTKGELFATLKASGRVKFMTPGGDGYCDELQVVPGTGDVLAVGHVKFSYNWGKVETSATAEKMNFQLGTKPKGN